MDDAVTPLAPALGLAACLRAAAGHRGRMRGFWLLLAAAMCCWTLAMLIWGDFALIAAVSVPVPSWTDLGCLGAIPLALAARVAHPPCTAAGGAGCARCSRAWCSQPRSFS